MNKHIYFLKFLSLKNIFVIATIFFSIKATSLSQPNAIIRNEFTSSDTVDMGLSLENVPITTIFSIQNIGTEALRLSTGPPSFSIIRVPESGVDDINAFSQEAGSLDNFVVQPNSTKQLKIIFSPIGFITPGKKIVRLNFGLYNASITQPKPSDIVVADSFLLIARKTRKYIDVYENVLFIDSVYVKPPVPIIKFIKIQNTTKDTLNIENYFFGEKLPFNAPIDMEGKPMPFALPPDKNIADFKITFYPVTYGPYSAVTKFYYKPKPLTVPDSLDSLKVNITAIGVEQYLPIKSVTGANLKRQDSSYYYKDVIDIGDVRVFEPKEFNIIFENGGNMPYGVKSQQILEFASENPAIGFNLVKRLMDTVNILPGIIDTVKVLFTPTSRGAFIARYIIESDIDNRNIFGYPDSIKKIEIFIKAMGVEPTISIEDTVDFGNIVMNSVDCPALRDTIITIRNNGNIYLEIKSIRVMPESPPTPFKVFVDNMNIAPRTTDTIRIRFDAPDRLPAKFDAELVFESNATPPRNNFKTYLKANGVAPDPIKIRLSEDNRAMPGRRIMLPILVDKDRVVIAKTFSDNLIYDQSLLRYVGFDKIGTACETASPENISIKEDRKGSFLEINIDMDVQKYFLSKDTLIKLYFDTFMGAKEIYTPITFGNPRFGDAICATILTPNKINSVFTLDSICGLAYKAGSLSNGKFRLVQAYPIPANDQINLEYEMALNIDMTLTIYNSYGEVVYNYERSNHPKGVYALSFNTSQLSPGVYICDMKAGIYLGVINVVISR